MSGCMLSSIIHDLHKSWKFSRNFDTLLSDVGFSHREVNRQSIAHPRQTKQGKLCPHNRRPNTCVDCGGRSVCEHGRQRAQCRECGGSLFCAHGRRKRLCLDGCGGSGLCVHVREQSQCRLCGGSQICVHGRRLSKCRHCGGSQVCVHGRQRSNCRECGGSSITRVYGAIAGNAGAARRYINEI